MVIVGYYAHGNKHYVAFNENEERPDRFMITDGVKKRYWYLGMEIMTFQCLRNSRIPEQWEMP